VLSAEDATAVIESVVTADVLETDGTLVQLCLVLCLLARQANMFFGHVPPPEGRDYSLAKLE
jgi:hypothetical protein